MFPGTYVYAWKCNSEILVRHIFKDKDFFFSPEWFLAIFHLNRVYESFCWSTPCQNLVLSALWLFAYLVNIKLYHIVIWICISIISTKMMSSFICRDMYIFVSLKCLYMSFAYFYTLFLHFFSYWVRLFLKVITLQLYFKYLTLVSGLSSYFLIIYFNKQLLVY